MYSYLAYGLGFRSEIPLSGLVTADAGRDVVVHRGDLEPPPDAPAERTEDGAVVLRYADAGSFSVSGGSRVVVDPLPGAGDALVRRALLSMPLGALLHQRGLLALHGSAVAVDGRAVAFLGGKGRGKSTTAAALYDRGHAAMADDVTAVGANGSTPTVRPGFPLLKLRPEVAAALDADPEAVPGDPGFEKPYYRADRGFPREPLSLDRIYVLEEGPNRRVEPIDPGDAVAELVRHTYAFRLPAGIDEGTIAHHFRRCAAVADSTPVRRLAAPRDGDPDATARLVEEDLDRDG